MQTISLKDDLKLLLISNQWSDTKYQISKFIISELEKNNFPSIQEVAKNCFLATSTVVRFCKRLGFEGYKEFINKLKFENIINNNLYIKSKESDFFEMWEAYKNQLVNWLEFADNFFEQVQDVSLMIDKVDNIYLYFNNQRCFITNFIIDILIFHNKNIIYPTSFKTNINLNPKPNNSSLEIFFLEDESCTFNISNLDNKDIKKIIFNFKNEKLSIENAIIINLFNGDLNEINFYNNDLKLFYFFKQLLIYKKIF